MADNRRFLGGISYQLSGGGAVIGATSITIDNFVDADGNAITMAGSFGTKGYGTLQPSTTDYQEFITFTGVTDNGDGTSTLTGVSTQLAQYPYTETSGLALSHPGASTFIISNTPGFYDGFTNKNDAEEIVEQWTFDQAPASPANALATNELPNLGQVTALINGGTISVDKQIVAGVAGETITKDQLIYLKASDGRWWKCDADTAATVEGVMLGLAQGGGTAGVAITNGVLVSGLATLTAFSVTAATVYYASNTAGGISTSAGTTSKVIGEVPSGSTTTIYFNPNYTYIPTALQLAAIPSTGEKQAMAGGSTFGTPSSSNKFITQDYNSSATGLPVVRTYAFSTMGDSTTQYDITNPAGTTFRYTYDGTGTNPNINATTFPAGTIVYMFRTDNASSFANSGTFTITGSGSNYYEVTNASGVIETNVKYNNTSSFFMAIAPQTWSKPAGLKYAKVQVQAGGAGGPGVTTANSVTAGGSAGGYSEELLAASVLGATETVTVGSGGRGGWGGTAENSVAGLSSSFGSLLSATGGALSSGNTPGTPGTGSGGDLNLAGGYGFVGVTTGAAALTAGVGGSSQLGRGGYVANNGTQGGNGSGYGSGGSGVGCTDGADKSGGAGMPGIVIVTEYYS